MPNLRVDDISRLAFPRGVRQQYAALVWESQRQYFVLLIAFGALLFLLGGMM